MASGKSIVLGYDRSPGARRALDIAIELAGSFDVLLVLVHGIAPPNVVGEEAGQAREALDDMDEQVAAPAVAAAEAAGVRVLVEVVDSRPAPALIAAADEHDALVIVVGTWNESPLRGALLGSVSHKLLQISARPVLCVPATAPDAS
ncbi:universal stress protein [Pseudonocardia broussonetiae]|uniref:Universal stress protein n=1 Tax=Pseudonocardia broussonetiae TaxID=2736640 RepID=A0A6M6JTG8_9PSEU|nr:universal stress protein [Pseudonocardia broussonetiae]QJY49862.1 universal stress protein [Pseudonocardia broussonetiae]